MPILSQFYGITIRMYFLQSEHNPPHIHAIYGATAAAIDIQTGEIIDGSLPIKIKDLVQSWMCIYKEDLMQIWITQEFRKIPPLD